MIKMDQQKIMTWLPGFCFIVFWPCVVHIEEMNTGLSAQPWFPQLSVQRDLFLKARGKILIFLAVFMLLVVCDRIIVQKKKLLRKAILIFTGLLALLDIFSVISSVNLECSLSGAYEQYETLWVLLSYLMVFLYFADIMREKYAEKIFLCCILAGSLLQGILGLTQFLHRDFWASDWGRAYLTWGTAYDPKLLTYISDSAHKVYMSFYNPNYAGIYCVLMIPLLSGIFALKWKWNERGMACVSIGLLCICLWGSGSKTGFLTGVILILLNMGKQKFEKYKKYRCRILSIGAGIFLLCLILYMFLECIYQEKNLNTWIPRRCVYSLQEIETLENEILLTFLSGEYHISVEEEKGKASIFVTDQDGKRVFSNKVEDMKEYQPLKDFPDLKIRGFSEKNENYLVILYEEKEWIFVKDQIEQAYFYINRYGQRDKIETALCAWGKGYEKTFTNRFYIWSRTIPVLKKYWFLGAGPNTFPLIFPQSDYVTRANISRALEETLITRPHSLYLQMVAQTGIFSLLIFLKLLIYIWSVSKERLFTDKRNTLQYFLWLSLTAYLIMGITNDAIVVSAPWFWMILGCIYGRSTEENNK